MVQDIYCVIPHGSLNYYFSYYVFVGHYRISFSLCIDDDDNDDDSVGDDHHDNEDDDNDDDNSHDDDDNDDDDDSSYNTNKINWFISI